MAFSKSFPRKSDKSVYPQWEEVYLTEEEESDVEKKARESNMRIMKECIIDARKVMDEANLKDFETNLVRIARALFEKRASHDVFLKESKAKEKFDKTHSSV